MAAPALIADGSASSAPLVIRSFVEREDDEAEEGALAAFVADEDDKVSEDACSAVCATHYIAGAKTEREALCSPKGLQNTRESAWQWCICGHEQRVNGVVDCALCIDNTWPDTTWQESAMAEYERIVEACEQAPQK